MGGRGSNSGMTSSSTTSYNDFYNIDDANAAFGFGNGGEADQWTAGLSKEEKRAIHNYSLKGYATINKKLRKLKEGKDLDPDSSVGKRANAIEEAIGRYNLDQPTTFHRSGYITDFLSNKEFGRMVGMSSNERDVAVANKLNSLVGQVIHDKGFTSTSASRDKRSQMGGTVEYSIKTRAGKGIGAYIAGASYYKDSESEFLFNRGSGFKITGMRTSTRTGTTLLGDKYTETMYHVDMEYVGRSR